MALQIPEITKEPKDLRYRKQHFPNAEDLVFNTQRKGFIPLSILTRKLLRHLSALTDTYTQPGSWRWRQSRSVD